MKVSKLPIFLIPFGLSLCILCICYPGFMSYDSIRMLEEARSSVRGGIYPVVPVYMLRVFDITGHGTTLMLQAQNFILLLSMMLILNMLGAGLRASALALLALLASPTVIGCMLVLWKDVTNASLVMLSVAIIFWASRSKKEESYFEIAKWTSLSLLLLATLVRFNSITSTAVILFYWLVVFYKDRNWKPKSVLFVVILVFMAASNKIVNNYTFPDFKRLQSNNLVYVVMTYDLIGISRWSRDSLIPIGSVDSEPLPKASISDVDMLYSSLGALAINANNVALGNIVRFYPTKYKNEDISRAWVAAIFHHPTAYLKYRWDLFSEIVGATFHATFEPTHYAGIDQNSFGIEFKDSLISRLTLKYIQSTSSMFLGKPWLVFLLSILSVFLVHKSRFICLECKRLSYFTFAAALLYIFPFFIISGTGEVRYSFPAIVLSSISVFIWIFAQYLPQRNAKEKIERKTI